MPALDSHETSQKQSPLVAVVLPSEQEHSQLDERTWRLSFYITDETPGVKAHFPETPLIAGYMQLLWVEHLFSLTNSPYRLSEVSDIKFLKRIIPPNQISVQITFNLEKSNFSFYISDSEGVNTKGSCRYVEAGSSPSVS